MKKLLLLTSLLVGFSTLVWGAKDSVNTWQEAELAYENTDYLKAFELWSSLEGNNRLPNADLHYNLGNAAYKGGQLGKAILHWNKALALNPSMDDARFNLAKAELQKVDNITPIEPSALVAFSKSIWSYFAPSTWGLLALIGFLSATLAFAGFKFSKASLSGLFLPTAFILLGLGMGCTVAGIRHQHAIDHTVMAVVLNPNIYVKSAPLTQGADAFILHEGTEMEVIKQIHAWYEIRLADGKVGWVNKDEVGVY